MKRSWMLAGVLASLLWPIAASAQDVKNQKPKTEALDAAKLWSERLTEHQLLMLPNRNTDAFKNALNGLALYADGPRDHVDDYLKAAGYPVDAQNST